MYITKLATLLVTAVCLAAASPILSGRQGECPCAPGLCCSQWGYCGTGPDFCGGTSVIIPPPTFVSSRPQPTTSPGGGGACAGGCPAGMCCSQWGYCGTGPEYCG
ncbi:uncharacterized protein B0H64DRAFT_371181 [Chaetomium fimeti]|uniref:Chitin-binding type-1 domain-containing protein n=1 Tax=Chaetomium fimeti TaxID=1854472 RepID=A0AAE0HN89_9PEZI|nr:hypothetical protein B0H64DRAFT_371181 [Chaetomium fimeti]